MISITLAKFKDNLLAAGVSHAAAATLGGLKPSTLSSAFRGITRLESTKEAELLTISFRLLELEAALRPLKLPENVSYLEQLLARVKNEEITPALIRSFVSRIFGEEHE